MFFKEPKKRSTEKEEIELVSKLVKNINKLKCTLVYAIEVSKADKAEKDICELFIVVQQILSVAFASVFDLNKEYKKTKSQENHSLFSSNLLSIRYTSDKVYKYEYLSNILLWGDSNYSLRYLHGQIKDLIRKAYKNEKSLNFPPDHPTVIWLRFIRSTLENACVYIRKISSVSKNLGVKFNG